MLTGDSCGECARKKRQRGAHSNKTYIGDDASVSMATVDLVRRSSPSFRESGPEAHGGSQTDSEERHSCRD